MKYAIFIDESGVLENNSDFIVGGYVLENRGKDTSEIHIKPIFEELKQKYNYGDVILHKTKLIRKETNKLKKEIAAKYNIKGIIEDEKNLKDGENKELYINNDYNIDKALAEKYDINVIKQYREEYKKTSGHFFNTLNSMTEELFEKTSPKYFIVSKYRKAAKGVLSNHTSQLYLYVQMVSSLIIEIIYKIYSELPTKEELDFDIVLSYRKDTQSNEKILQEPHAVIIEEAIDGLMIKYGIEDVIKYNITVDDESSCLPLAVADYMCNTYYNHEENKHIIENLRKENKLIETMYGLNIGEINIHIDKKNYAELIRLYLMHKKTYKKGGKWQTLISDVLPIWNEALKKNIEEDKNKRYFEYALLSILEYIEYESRALKNFHSILFYYKTLENLIRSFSDAVKNKYAMLFAVYTDSIAVCNHMGDSEQTLEYIDKARQYLEYGLKNNLFIERVWTFYNISAKYYEQNYNFDKSIEQLEDTIKKYTAYTDWQRLIIKDIGASNDDFDSSAIAKIYGSLGQNYAMKYLLTNDKSDREKSEDSFFQSIKYFGDEKNEIIKEYNYLMHLSVIEKNEDKFIKYMREYILNKTGDTFADSLECVKKIISYKDKYAINEIISFINVVETDITIKIKEYLKTEKDNIIKYKNMDYIDMAIIREYYLMLKSKIPENYIKEMDDFFNKNSIIIKLLKISFLSVRLYTEKDIALVKEINAIIDDISQDNDTIKNAFKKYESGDFDKWALDIKNRIYY